MGGIDNSVFRYPLYPSVIPIRVIQLFDGCDFHCLITHIINIKFMESLSKNGVSTTQEPGQEKYITFIAGTFRGTEYFQYDYRHTDGELFSTVTKTLEECRKRRDEWLLRDR